MNINLIEVIWIDRRRDREEKETAQQVSKCHSQSKSRAGPETEAAILEGLRNV